MTKRKHKDKLPSKADLVIACICYATKEFLNGITGKTKNIKSVSGLKKISKEEESVIILIGYVSFLFHAQQHFWEYVIKDEKKARLFEKELFASFERNVGFDPYPHMKEIADYVVKQGKAGQLMYPGFTITRRLDKSDFIVATSISTYFAAVLKHQFLPSLDRVWKQGKINGKKKT